MSISVVIGAGTTASFGNSGACIISAQWGFNPGRTDAFCLGAWEPNENYVVYKPTQTLSFTMYAPATSSIAIPPTEGCEDADTVDASVSPASCEQLNDIAGKWHVQSFSYSKESKDQAGQETWSLIKYKDGVGDFLTSQGVASDRIAIPSYVTRGITMGEATDTTQTGVTFSSTYAQAQSGSVSAGAIGRASTVIYGVVSHIGGGSSSAGFAGTGSASIPYTPLYI